MEDNITVLVDAKLEYTKQLTQIIIPFIFEGIKSIYTSTISMCKINNDKKLLMRFQEQLSQIPKWNQDIIDEEYNRIIENSKCDWLDDLVTAVFLSHTKILTAIKSGNKQNKINLKIPKIDHFIHKCYIESAREFWKNPYIFSNQVSQSEYQRNISDGHKIIGNCIEETIRKLLPVKNILKEYLGSNYEEDTSMLPENYKANLKKLVQKELEICKAGETIDEDKIIDKLEKIEEMEEINIGIDKNKKKNIEVKNLEMPDLDISDNEDEIEETNNDLETVKLELTPLSSDNNLDDLNLENLKLDEFDLEDITTSNNTEENTKLTEEVKLEVKPVEEEVKLELKPVEEEVKLEEVKLELKPVEEEVKLELKPVEESNTLSEVKLEAKPVEEEKPIEEVKLELKPVEEEKPIEKVNLEEKQVEEEKPIEEVNLEAKPVPEDIKQVKEIIDNNLYNKEIDTSSDNEEETTIENMKFKKLDLDTLNIDTLDSDLELDDIELDDVSLVNFKPIEDKDIEVEKNNESTHETLTKNKDTKTIIIEDDKLNSISKFSKPNKKKSYKFFD